MTVLVSYDAVLHFKCLQNICLLFDVLWWPWKEKAFLWWSLNEHLSEHLSQKQVLFTVGRVQRAKGDRVGFSSSSR